MQVTKAMSLDNHTVDVDIIGQILTYSDPAGGQLQQRCVKVTSGAVERPLGPEQRLSALHTDLKEVLQHASWEGTYCRKDVGVKFTLLSHCKL